MTAVKLLAGGMLIICLRGFGKSLARQQYVIICRLEGIISLLYRMQKMVESSNTPLVEIITQSKAQVLEEVGFYDCFDSSRIIVSRAWERAVDCLELDSESREILVSLCGNLGLLSREKQVEIIKEVKKGIEEIYGKRLEDYNKKSGYYGTLGVLLGALVLIIGL